MFHPNGFIKKVLGDGFCVIRAFQEGFSICYNENHKLCDVKAALLINDRERYKKNDKFLIYRMNDLTQNNQPTFVFKTSSVSLECICLF